MFSLTGKREGRQPFIVMAGLVPIGIRIRPSAEKIMAGCVALSTVMARLIVRAKTMEQWHRTEAVIVGRLLMSR
jgi:hypothetical protein